ncbi:MAG: hypothetical protein ABEJ83_02645 [Candidatus Nanohaloarchaea archaeon]
MRPEVEIAVQDVQDLLELAEIAKQEGLQNRTVASLLIRAVLRGNDALCLKYLDETPTRHSHAPEYFQRLYENGHVSDELSKYRTTINDLEQQKSTMEYRATEISKNDLDRLEKRARRFITNAVEPNVG